MPPRCNCVRVPASHPGWTAATLSCALHSLGGLTQSFHCQWTAVPVASGSTKGLVKVLVAELTIVPALSPSFLLLLPHPTSSLPSFSATSKTATTCPSHGSPKPHHSFPQIPHSWGDPAAQAGQHPHPQRQRGIKHCPPVQPNLCPCPFKSSPEKANTNPTWK